jgi:hypothetical protein
MPATALHPITNGSGMDQEDYMRRRCKFFIIALGACMVALMSYDGIVKPLSKKVCCVIDGMLHSRVSWFQQRVVDRANCLCCEVMSEINTCDSLGDINSRVSRIKKRYADNVDPWGTKLSVDVVAGNRSFEIMLCSAGNDKTFGTDDDVSVTNKVIIGNVRRCGSE